MTHPPADGDNRAYYDEFALTYEDQRHHGYHALIDALECGLAAPASAGRDVLEVGCGTGLILRRLADVARSAVGVDLSEGMLGGARKRGLRAVQGSATALPFADASFDLVCSFKVLAHVEPIEQALAEIARVTRPGGTLLLEFYNRRSVRHLAKVLAGPKRIGGSATTEAAIGTRWDTLASLRNALPPGVTLAGIHGVRIFTPAAFVHRVPVVRQMLAWLERVGRDSVLGRFGGFLVLRLEKNS